MTKKIEELKTEKTNSKPGERTYTKEIEEWRKAGKSLDNLVRLFNESLKEGPDK